VTTSTSERILDAALEAFGTTGYAAVSLDALAVDLGVSKQTILYWFPSKEALLAAVVKQGAGELTEVVEASLEKAGEGFDRVRCVVRAVFRLAARHPALLGLLREVSRLGPPAATQMTECLEPLLGRATAFLQAEMDAGKMRTSNPRLLLLAMYSTVIGMLTEVDVLAALGEEVSARSLVRRRSDVLELLRSALMVEPNSSR